MKLLVFSEMPSTWMDATKGMFDAKKHWPN
jgi:hypothetical protein